MYVLGHVEKKIKGNNLLLKYLLVTVDLKEKKSQCVTWENFVV